MAKRGPKEDIFEEVPADLIREHRGTYLIVNAVSRRVRQLQLGDKELTALDDGGHDPTLIALKELSEGKLEIVVRVPVPEDHEPLMRVGE